MQHRHQVRGPAFAGLVGWYLGPAKHLVATGHDLEVIAEKVGYSDAATLRNPLRRKLGRGARELRSELG